MRATLYYSSAHQVLKAEGLAAVSEVLDMGLRHFWLDIEAADEATVRWLEERFHFHPLALEDLLQPNYRPKLAQYDDHLFLIAHELDLPDSELAAHEVQAFLTHDFLITAHDVPVASVDRVRQILEGEASILGRGADHLLYLLLDEMAETFFKVADRVDDLLDELQIQVLERASRALLDRVFALRRGLSTARRLSSHQRDAINSLAAHEETYVRRGNALYLRDVQNLMVTVHEIIDSQRDLSNGVLEVYLSATSNHLNDIMRRLTIVATVFLPLSFIAGVFGTNFVFMPFDSPVWFFAFIISLIATTAGMGYWFKRSGWL